LDVGAGPGIYATALLRHGVIQTATCLDYDYAIEMADVSVGDSITWQAGDALVSTVQKRGYYDAVYLGNILHHYALKNCCHLLDNVSASLTERSLVVVQDYVAEELPFPSSLYASILGVHFALTTDMGRCYTAKEIRSVIEEAVPGQWKETHWKLDACDLIVFRRHL
jgi:2-polyprenyl-3-methyl-5-hydroxy-6-metoxy-1,4-benzoquinol methylase